MRRQGTEWARSWASRTPICFTGLAGLRAFENQAPNDLSKAHTVCDRVGKRTQISVTVHKANLPSNNILLKNWNLWLFLNSWKITLQACKETGKKFSPPFCNIHSNIPSTIFSSCFKFLKFPFNSDNHTFVF